MNISRKILGGVLFVLALGCAQPVWADAVSPFVDASLDSLSYDPLTKSLVATGNTFDLDDRAGNSRHFGGNGTFILTFHGDTLADPTSSIYGTLTVSGLNGNIFNSQSLVTLAYDHEDSLDSASPIIAIGFEFQQALGTVYDNQSSFRVNPGQRIAGYLVPNLPLDALFWTGSTPQTTDIKAEVFAVVPLPAALLEGAGLLGLAGVGGGIQIWRRRRLQASL